MPGYFEPEPLSDEYVADLRRAQADVWGAAQDRISRDRKRYEYIRDNAGAPWPPADPREVLYRTADEIGALQPTPTHSSSRYQRDLGRAAMAPLDALGYVFGAPGRARDGLIVAGQDLNAREVRDEETGEWRPMDPYTDAPRPEDVRYADGSYGRALQSLAGGVAGMVYPPASSGRPGGPRDWRVDAEKLGINPWNTAAIDIGTDPLTYVGLPMAKGVRAAQALRYGGGKPAYLIDSSGDVIRRLRATPAVRVASPAGYLP